MSVEQSDLAVMDPEGVVDSPKDLQLTAQGQALARFVASILMEHYEGWRWGVTVDERGGVIHVFAMDLSGELGYTVLLDDLWNLGNFDKNLVIIMGGEILERYGLPRRSKMAGWQAHCRWVGGVPVPDVSDKASGVLKHLARRNRIAAGA